MKEHGKKNAWPPAGNKDPLLSLSRSLSVFSELKLLCFAAEDDHGKKNAWSF